MFGRALLSPFSFLTPFVSLQEILRSTAQSRYLEIGSSRRSLLSYPPLHPVTQNLTFLVSLPITAVSPKYGPSSLPGVGRGPRIYLIQQEGCTGVRKRHRPR